MLAPWWWLALVPVGTVLLVVLATSLPARLATRIPHRRRAPLRVSCRYGRTTRPVCTASSALAGIVLIPFSASSSQPGSTAPPT